MERVERVKEGWGVVERGKVEEGKVMAGKEKEGVGQGLGSVVMGCTWRRKTLQNSESECAGSRFFKGVISVVCVGVVNQGLLSYEQHEGHTHQSGGTCVSAKISKRKEHTNACGLWVQIYNQ